MIRHPVDSSNILSIGHDPATKRMEIEYRGRNGAPSTLYEYDNVDAKDHAALMKAKSHGSHLAKKMADIYAKGKKVEQK